MSQHHLRLALATATAAALTGGLLTFATTAATAADSTKVAQADFNGDGIGDIATSAATSYVNGHKNAGQVVVLYGSKSGTTAANRSRINQDTAGVPGIAEAGDEFGAGLAYADFNGDGYTDLAVGSPGEKTGSDTNAGAVAILWGSAKGITGAGISVADPTPTTHDYWGKLLAAGDFDGDGTDDLAVGASTRTIWVFKGGFTTSGTHGAGYTINPPIQKGSDSFPYGPLNLTAGDVNGDGKTDLVVDGYNTTSSYGWNTNYWIPGSGVGLRAAATKVLKTGLVTGIGDINGDGYGDIVSGADWNGTLSDGTTVPDSAKGGKVNITYGTAAGPGTTAGVTQNSGTIPGVSESGDGFGWDLDLGDINGDGYQDLVVSAPDETIGKAVRTGQVTVLYGSKTGIRTASWAQVFNQSTPGVTGTDEKNDLFGADVKLDDVNGDGRADLIIGSYEDGGDGQVMYLPSNGTKIVTTGAHTISATAAGISTVGTPQFGALFAD
ncbi:FG-GAP repeat protein [Actinobacteria bacterium OK074]|nr:FG-GAP repeat protein [Actinobacteria bacterium OK074]